MSISNHQNTGRSGEALAAQYYLERGFSILEQNWRYAHYEIDLIVSCNGVLHFVEVKTRRALTYGYPEEAVNRVKLRAMMNGAVNYLLQQPQWKRVQYDILSILLHEGKPPEFFLVEDVYLYK